MLEGHVELERYNRELETAFLAARNAGKQIISQRTNSRAEKSGLELKTEVDNLADRTIKRVIAEAFPNDSILTEESGFPQSPAERLWVVDPIDGTTNFINGLRAYSTLIAFVDKGKLVIGVSFLPQSQEMFWAVDGEGAYKGNTKITVSQMADIGKASIVLDPGYHPQGVEKISDAWGKLRPNVGNVGVLNANGYTLSLIANGELPALIHFYSKVWECAGLLLVTEAGGKVTNFKGHNVKLDFARNDGFEFVASNGLIHNALLELLNK